MSRPNKLRNVLAEVNLARRIAAERETRGWTNDGLAKRMTDVGCAITGSAIFKIEKGEPRRRIVVDELVAFARVFDVPIDELLVSPEIAVSGEVTRRVIDWSLANDRAADAIAERDRAWEGLTTFVAEHPDGTGVLAEVLYTWAEGHFPDGAEGARAYRMWKLTGDDKWAEIVRADVNRG